MEPSGISVIITSYNQKQLLREAIESTLDQSSACYEIIIADDCSSDGSQELIEEYARRHPHLIRPLLHERNLGIPGNRNAALEQVRGEYVAILDGDDRFLPEKNQRELEAFQRNGEAQVVYSNVFLIDADGTRIGLRRPSTEPSGRILKEVFAGRFGILRSMLVRYSALRKVGFMDPAFWFFDGFDLTIRLANEYAFVYIPQALTEHRIHSGGCSRSILEPSISLQELRGIYQKNRHLLDGLPRADAQNVELWWLARLASLEAKAALSAGHHARAFKQWMRAVRLSLTMAKASPLRNTVRRVWRGARWRP